MPGPDNDELRIALVMNGGVSLAVWIGGVTAEIAGCIGDVPQSCGADDVYGRLRQLMQTKVRVDIICGTSAGGINGCYLGLALARCGQAVGKHIGGLRGLWIADGDIEGILRNPLFDKVPSLLDGEVFYGKIRSAFKDLWARGSGSSDPLDVIITTTLLQGARRKLSDVFGNTIVDVAHRARFVFSRGDTTKPGGDLFAKEEIIDQMAVAARSTASFPGAFEPHFVRVDDAEGLADLPNLKDVADFTTSGFVVDGGVVDNSPIDYALERIFRQRATGPVRRALAFVIPDPGAGKKEPAPLKKAAIPGMMQVALASVIDIPSTQSIADQIRQINERNDHVDQLRTDRIVLVATVENDEIDKLSTTLFETFVAQRKQDAIRLIIAEIEKGFGLIDKGIGRRGRREWLILVLSDMKDLPFIPGHPPFGEESDGEQTYDAWKWGTLTVTHMSRLYLDLVRRTQRLLVLVPSIPATDLTLLWQSAFRSVAKIDGIRAGADGFWQADVETLDIRLKQSALGTTAGGPSAEDWMTDKIASWRKGEFTRAGRLAQDIAAGLVSLNDVAHRVLSELTPDKERPDIMAAAQELRLQLAYLVRGDQPNDAVNVIKRLLALEVVNAALGVSAEKIEQEIEYVQISGNAPSVLMPGSDDISKRLTGLQLAHFGAFYKSSWRANDWMWGRLNAVPTLVRLLLDPIRVEVVARQWSTNRADQMARLLADIALDPPKEGDPQTPDHADLIAKISAQLAYLDDPALILPERLTSAIDAIVARIERSILCEELPNIALQISCEDQQKWHLSFEARKFILAHQGLKDMKSLTSTELQDFLRLCVVGEERLADDIGTDRLSAISARAFAVAVAGLRGEEGFLKVAGRTLGALRIPSLVLYAYMDSLAKRQKIGLVLGTGVFVFGVATILAALFGATWPQWLATLGVVFTFFGLFSVLLRLRNWAMLIVSVLAAAAVIGAVFVWKKSIPIPDTYDAGLARKGVALGLVAGAVVLLVLGSYIPIPKRGPWWETLDDWIWKKLTTPICGRKSAP